MTAYEMRIRDWSSDVCSSDLHSSVSDRKHRASGLLVLYRLYMSHQEVCLGGSDFDDPALAAQPIHRDRKSVVRERVCQYVSISVVAVSLKKKHKRKKKITGSVT